MNKELTELIALSDKNKTMKLNGCFELRAEFIDRFGVSVELSKKEPTSLRLSLVYTLPHDKFLSRSVEIKARDSRAIVEETAERMVEMMASFGDELAKQIRSGYIQGGIS